MTFRDWYQNQIIECFDGKKITRAEFNNQVYKKIIEDATSLGTDLVEATRELACCAECAKYRGRWFSISGKDKRFPKMPINYGCTCQGINFFPVIYGISEPTYCSKSMNIIEYSNRPFIDDRKSKEKKDYNMWLKQMENEQQFEPYKIRLNKITEKDKREYEWLCKNLPNIAPKSFSGYTKMKRSYSKNFLKLSEQAKELGKNICYSDSELAELESIKPYQEIYFKVKKECSEYFKKK